MQMGTLTGRVGGLAFARSADGRRAQRSSGRTTAGAAVCSRTISPAGSQRRTGTSRQYGCPAAALRLAALGKETSRTLRWHALDLLINARSLLMLARCRYESNGL